MIRLNTRYSSVYMYSIVLILTSLNSSPSLLHIWPNLISEHLPYFLNMPIPYRPSLFSQIYSSLLQSSLHVPRSQGFRWYEFTFNLGVAQFNNLLEIIANEKNGNEALVSKFRIGSFQTMGVMKPWIYKFFVHLFFLTAFWLPNITNFVWYKYFILI